MYAIILAGASLRCLTACEAYEHTRPRTQDCYSGGDSLLHRCPSKESRQASFDLQARRLKCAATRASHACILLLGGLVVRGLPDSTHSLLQEEDLPLLLGRSPEAFDSLLQ